MAVAVKNASEANPPNQHSPFDRLAVASLAGLAYVVGSIALVFYVIPWGWGQLFPAGSDLVNGFVDTALMVLVMLAASTGAWSLGMRLVSWELPHGLRGGIFLAGFGVVSVLVVSWCFGRLLESWLPAGESTRPLGLGLTVGLGAALVVWGLRKFLRAGLEETLLAIEDQGWLTFASYKRLQGPRVRRGTVLGVLILAGCGIWTLLAHNTLVYGLPDYNNWYVPVPFVYTADGSNLSVMLLKDVRFTVPLLMAAFSLWFAFRIVNFPTFADFLIATEAELNKVSWTTRKRLWQDTIVVLVTVVLLTVFLLLVDLLWGVLLNKVGVLQSPTASQQEDKRGEQPW